MVEGLHHYLLTSNATFTHLRHRLKELERELQAIKSTIDLFEFLPEFSKRDAKLTAFDLVHRCVQLKAVVCDRQVMEENLRFLSQLAATTWSENQNHLVMELVIDWECEGEVQHLEELRSECQAIKIETFELKSQLAILVYHHLIRLDAQKKVLQVGTLFLFIWFLSPFIPYQR